MRGVVIAMCAALAPLASGCSLLVNPDDNGGPSVNLDTCATLAPLHEEFQSTGLAPKWASSFREPAISYSQQDGTAIFDYTKVSTGTRAISSQFEHDARGNFLSVVVDQVADDFSADTFVELRSGADESTPPTATIRHDNGTLRFELDDGEIGDETYDPERDRLWQIREQDGALFFETGPSADQLEVRAQSRAFGDFDPAHVYAAFGLRGSTNEPGRVVFGGVNLKAEATGYCPGAEFADSFDDDRLNELWSRRSDAARCSFDLVAGSLEIALAGSGPCGLVTGRAIDLRGSQVEVRFDSPPLLPQGVITFGLFRGSSTSLTLSGSGQMFSTGVCDDDDCNSTTDVEVVGATIWRIRADDEFVYWELETADGEVTLLEQLPHPLDVSALSIDFTVHTIATTTVSLSGINAD